MIIMQIKDAGSVKHIIQYIEKVLMVEYQGEDKLLYLTEDNPSEVQLLDYIEGCRITIK